MSGPRTFKITDHSSITAPPFAVKEWTDTTMLVFDFSRWLSSDPTQYLAMASDVLFITNPQTQAGVWVPFPGGCCSQDTQAEPPPDINPLTLAGLNILPDGKKVELSLSGGTPGLAYLASFIGTAAPYARRKEVGVVMTCFALRPFTGTVLPPPPPTISVGGSVTLPVGSSGTVNINNTTGANITITLPSSPTLDQSLHFKDVAGNASVHALIIKAATGTIDSMTDYQLVSDFASIEIYWTGLQWGSR